MIQLTYRARERMIDVLIDEKSSMLRFGLQGGGCSGFSYYFSIATEKEDGDYEIELDEAHKLVVDAISMMYLTNAEIDYKTDLMGDSFVFNNPDVKTSCGCGQSVSF